jgi:cytoskeletal protein RodZ
MKRKLLICIITAGMLCGIASGCHSQQNTETGTASEAGVNTEPVTENDSVAPAVQSEEEQPSTVSESSQENEVSYTIPTDRPIIGNETDDQGNYIVYYPQDTDSSDETQTQNETQEQAVPEPDPVQDNVAVITDTDAHGNLVEPEPPAVPTEEDTFEYTYDEEGNVIF